jgi:hypothetical protein
MKEWIAYLGEIMLITAVSGLFCHIAPEGNMKKHLHFVISLCVLVALCVPMFSMVMTLPEIFEQGFEEVRGEEDSVNGDLSESLIAVSKRKIESSIVSYISDVYGIPREHISAETVLDTSDTSAIEIREVRVTLHKDARAFAREIQGALDEMFLGKSEIAVSVEE